MNCFLMDSTAQHSCENKAAKPSAAQQAALVETYFVKDLKGFLPEENIYHPNSQHGTAQHSTAQHSTAQHSTAQHSTAQHSTAQHSTAQHSTAQHSTAQHSTAQQVFTSMRADKLGSRYGGRVVLAYGHPKLLHLTAGHQPGLMDPLS